MSHHLRRTRKYPENSYEPEDSRQFRDTKIRVTVAPNREKRSLDQNAYYWGFGSSPICEYTGYTPKQQDDVFQNLFAPREVKKWRGREIVTIKHYKDLSTFEFMEFLDRIIAEAADMGIVIPLADPFEIDTTLRCMSLAC